MPDRTDVLCCPSCRAGLRSGEVSWSCPSCRTEYPVRDGIPFLVKEDGLAGQDRYIQRVYDVLALGYDLSVRMLFPLLGVTEERLRREIMDFMPARIEGPVLEVSIGTGANVPLLAGKYPGTPIYGIDISSGMLRKCARRSEVREGRVAIYGATASRLPFRDGRFGAVLHVGGLNSFADKEGALREMLRVLAPGGVVVINDEGLSEERRRQWYARFFIRAIFGLVASLERGDTEPPLANLPPEAAGVRLESVGNGYFWVLTFHKPEAC